MKKIIVCELCGSNDFKMIFSNYDRMHGGPGIFTIMKCTNCSLVMHQPQLEINDLSIYYPSTSYYSYNTNVKKATTIQQVSDYLYNLFFLPSGSLIFRLLLFPVKSLLRTCLIIPNGKFLDVGCGSGNFLLKMKNFGMECYGVETGNCNIDVMKKYGLTVLNNDLISCQFNDNFFDVISFNHVFEHLSNPTEILKEVYRILKPNGQCIIAVPNISSFSFWFFRKYWIGLDTPRHLFLFSPKTLRSFVKNSKLQIVSLKYISTARQFFGSFFYFINNLLMRDHCMQNNHILNKMDQGHFSWLNAILNLVLLPLAYLLNIFHIGDTVEIILKKNE